jgi:anti-sigma factor RsiW
MTTNPQHRLQAYLDGELPVGEARDVEAWIAGDAEAQALAQELRQTVATLRHNELPAALTESREFYWSHIRRRIHAEAARETGPARHHYAFGWRQLLASFAGVSAVFAFLMLSARQIPSPAAPVADEVEAVGDQVQAVTFHASAANMTVVYLQNNPRASAPDAAADSLPE